jgi:hypothetical protein
MGEKRNTYRLLAEISEETTLKNLCTYGWRILQCILNKQDGRVD